MFSIPNFWKGRNKIVISKNTVKKKVMKVVYKEEKGVRGEKGKYAGWRRWRRTPQRGPGWGVGGKFAC